MDTEIIEATLDREPCVDVSNMRHRGDNEVHRPLRSSTKEETQEGPELGMNIELQPHIPHRMGGTFGVLGIFAPRQMVSTVSSLVHRNILRAQRKMVGL